MPQDLIDNVARAAAAPAPTITVNDELSIAASAICSLAARHVTLYENMVARARRGDRGFRLEESEKLLAIWSDAAKRIDEGRPLSSEQVREIEDALECGDYDLVLTPAELSVVRRWRGFH